MTPKRSFLIALSLILLFAATFLAGFWVHSQLTEAPSFVILSEAHDILKSQGLKDIPPIPILEYGMIRGMLQAYDEPNTIFLEPVQHELESDRLEGRFGGIGVQIEKDDQGFWTLYPFQESPAVLAGIEEGDRLFMVDGLDVSQETASDMIVSAIRGPVGEDVSITIGKPPEFHPIELNIKRQEIPIPSVSWRLTPSEPLLGIIDVNIIAASSVEEIEEAVNDLKERGATHFVLDLRDNPGGILTSGVDIARLFLEDGIVMQQQYRDQEVETFQVERPGPFIDLPLVVLINHGSASAAEIAAGALQVHDRAKLIGSPSFGKETIQLVFELQDHSSLRVTAARWWIPGLDPPISDAGLQPDILVMEAEDPTGFDLGIKAAIEFFFGKK